MPPASLLYERPRCRAARGARPLFQRRRPAVVRRSRDLRTDRRVCAELHAAAALAGIALRGRGADLRPFPDRTADRPRTRAQGLAQIGRLPGLRSGRGADRDRRQHRPLRRQAQPGRDGPQDQPGGGRRGRASTAPAQHRRHHHRRFHRHDARGRSQARQRRAGAGAQARQGAQLDVADLGARAGADDAQAHPRKPRGDAHRAVPRSAKGGA